MRCGDAGLERRRCAAKAELVAAVATSIGDLAVMPLLLYTHGGAQLTDRSDGVLFDHQSAAATHASVVCMAMLSFLQFALSDVATMVVAKLGAYTMCNPWPRHGLCAHANPIPTSCLSLTFNSICRGRLVEVRLFKSLSVEGIRDTV